MRILIAEDDPRVASSLQAVIEQNPLYSVVGVVEDAPAAIEMASTHRVDIALLDLQLAHGSTGFNAAVHLQELGVMCLFVSGKAPNFAMADLAIGCLTKPFSADDLHLSLSIAEDLLRNRDAVRLRLPANLKLYGDSIANEFTGNELLYEDMPPKTAFRSSRTSLKMKVIHWIIGLKRD